jgi:hypothetical protein
MAIVEDKPATSQLKHASEKSFLHPIKLAGFTTVINRVVYKIHRKFADFGF